MGTSLDLKLSADEIIADLRNVDAKHVIRTPVIGGVNRCQFKLLLPNAHKVMSPIVCMTTCYRKTRGWLISLAKRPPDSDSKIIACLDATKTSAYRNELPSQGFACAPIPFGVSKVRNRLIPVAEL